MHPIMTQYPNRYWGRFQVLPQICLNDFSHVVQTGLPNYRLLSVHISDRENPLDLQHGIELVGYHELLTVVVLRVRSPEGGLNGPC